MRGGILCFRFCYAFDVRVIASITTRTDPNPNRHYFAGLKVTMATSASVGA